MRQQRTTYSPQPGPDPCAPGVVDGASARFVLRGVPASSGMHRGRARVLSSELASGPIEPGDVIVVRDANARWTPALSRAGALVTDTGGALSSLATIAREYGIPAVVGTAVATVSVRDGEIAIVDGTRGLVGVMGTTR